MDVIVYASDRPSITFFPSTVYAPLCERSIRLTTIIGADPAAGVVGRPNVALDRSHTHNLDHQVYMRPYPDPEQ